MTENHTKRPITHLVRVSEKGVAQSAANVSDMLLKFVLTIHEKSVRKTYPIACFIV